MEEARTAHARTGKPARRFGDFRYRTRKSWSCERRVIGKAEYLPNKPSPRFVVTNLPTRKAGAKRLYETLYCARGDMENRIKERQLGLFADRTSSATMRANQLRLYFSSFAYVPMHGLRRLGLAGTAHAKEHDHPGVAVEDRCAYPDHRTQGLAVFLGGLSLPDYHRTSAILRSRSGMGGVRTAM